MREKLYFIYQVLVHLDGLIIGYEITSKQSSGKKHVYCYLHVSKNREMEVDLGLGQLLKSRNGYAKMFKEISAEEL